MTGPPRRSTRLSSRQPSESNEFSTGIPAGATQDDTAGRTPARRPRTVAGAASSAAGGGGGADSGSTAARKSDRVRRAKRRPLGAANPGVDSPGRYRTDGGKGLIVESETSQLPVSHPTSRGRYGEETPRRVARRLTRTATAVGEGGAAPLRAAPCRAVVPQAVCPVWGRPLPLGVCMAPVA